MDVAVVRVKTRATSRYTIVVFNLFPFPLRVRQISGMLQYEAKHRIGTLQVPLRTGYTGQFIALVTARAVMGSCNGTGTQGLIENQGNQLLIEHRPLTGFPLKNSKR